MHPLESLAAYRDLTPEERRATDAHLAACAECRATLAAYQRQDAALRAIPEIRPRRTRLPFPDYLPPSRLRRALALSGNALAMAGLAALLWLLALQAQAATGAGNAATAGSPLPEPGYTLPPTRVQLPSPWLPALPWIVAALLLVGLLFIFSRRSPWPPVAGALASALLLASFVPPLSAFPNPAALYWRATGGYSYDPRLPFKNSFMLAGNPDRQLRPYLDNLIGQVGLTPLDPNQPLADYQILRVGLHPHKNRTALVTTRFIYADGTSRVYPVPLLWPAVDVRGFLLAGWRADGLQRLRSEHLALSGQPFAGPDSPLRIGPARRLDLHPAANRLDEANPGHWLWTSVRVQRLVPAPDGDSFLLAIESDTGARQLWQVPFDGAPPLPVGDPGDIREYGWTPDSGAVVYTRLDPDAQAAAPDRPFAIIIAAPGARSRPRTLATALSSDRLPGLSPQGVWFLTPDGMAWIAPFDGAPPLPQRELAGLGRPALPPRPAPDGSVAAFACGPDLCLPAAGAPHPLRVPGLTPAEIAWSPDGSKLAVIERDPNNLRPVQLHILTRDGERLLTVEVAPRDATDPPQWTPDGAAVLMQTYPQDGRRIIAVDLASGQVLDLSQEHWDAYFALLPGGHSLLLNNGRGDFWVAEIAR